MKTFYYVIFISIIFLSCSSSDEVSPNLKLPTTGITLSSLAVGQKMHYLRYESDCGQNDFKLVGDTLLAELIEEDGILYLKESFTPGSMTEATASLTKVEIRDGYLLLTNRQLSPLLYFYGNDSLFVNKPAESVLRQSGCRLEINSEPFIGEEVGLLDEFSFGQIFIEDKMGVSCIPLIFEIDGFLAYDSDFLYLSHTISEDMVNGFVAVDL